MTTVLGDKLNQAFEAKNNDVETFLWNRLKTKELAATLNYF